MEFFEREREGEKVGVRRRRRREEVGVTLQPAPTPSAWLVSVMKWPLWWRPCLNKGFYSGWRGVSVS